MLIHSADSKNLEVIDGIIYENKKEVCKLSELTVMTTLKPESETFKMLLPSFLVAHKLKKANS